MKKLLLVLLFVGGQAGATLHTIDSVTVDSTAYTVKIWIAGMDSSGSHKFWKTADSTHADPTQAMGKIMVKRLGYSHSTGNRDTLYDTLTIDTVISRNYSNQAYDSCSTADGNIVFTCALNACIFKNDTVKSISIEKGLFYTATDTTNTFSSSSANNHSVEGYDSIKVVGNSTRPPRFCVDEDFYIACAGIHQSARNGQPLACVQFHVEDQHSHSWDTTVYHAGIDSVTIYDSIKIVEYVAKVPIATFTVGDTLTKTWKMKPWYGDSLWSGDGVNTTEPTPLYAARKYYYNTQWAMYIDSATGNDATGDTVQNHSWNPASPPAACATLGGAISRARTLTGLTNLLGRVVFYVNAGGYNLWGATITSGTLSTYNLEFRNMPGTQPRIIAQSGSAALPGADSYLYFKGFKTVQTTGNIFSSEKSLILDSCEDNKHGGTTVYTVNCVYFNNCRMDTLFKCPSNASINASLAICRNTEFKYAGASSGTIVPYTFIGNRSRGSSVAFSDSVSGMTSPTCRNTYIASNNFVLSQVVGNLFVNTSLIQGFAYVQNIFEKYTSTNPSIQIAADGSVSKSVNNVMMFNNAVLGERMNGPYNDFILNDSTTIRWRKHWVFRNNYFDYVSRGVTSWDTHGGTAGTPRYGNWMTIWGTNIKNNIDLSRPATYSPKFCGINSYLKKLTYANDGSFNAFRKNVGDSSYVGSAAGWGNYHLNSGSPFIKKCTGFDQALPFDLEAKPRSQGSDSGAIGPYIYATEYSGCTAPVVVRDSIIGKVGITYTDTVKLSAGTATKITVLSGTMPSSLTLDTLTGKITGTATTIYPRDSVRFKAWGCANDSNYWVFEVTIDTFTVTPMGDESVNVSSLNGTSFELGEVCSLIVDVTAGYAYKINSGSPAYTDDTLLITIGGDTAITAVSYRIPVIDSVRDSTAVRDPIYLQSARPTDTIKVFGVGFSTLGDSTSLLLNSTGSVKGTILSVADGLIVVIIPSGTPRGWYSSWVRTKDMVVGTPKYRGLQVKRPGGV